MFWIGPVVPAGGMFHKRVISPNGETFSKSD